MSPGSTGVRQLAATLLFAILLTGGLVNGYRLVGFGRHCYTLVVASSEEKSAMLQGFARSFGTRDDSAGSCFNVEVDKVNSGEAETALAAGWKGQPFPRPDVWSPASTAWVALLGASPPGAALVPAGTPPMLFYSPLVIGMPQPMAAALGYPGRPVGWSTVLALATNPAGWGSVPGAQASWGAFRLGKTNPTISTSGLHALVAAFFAKSGDLTPAAVADPSVRAFIGGIESGVVHYGATASDFLSDLWDADNSGSALQYVSAVAVEEKELLDYNRGVIATDRTNSVRRTVPRVPLVAVYPAEGTLMANHPYVTLTDSRHADAATRFLRWIQEKAQQDAILQAGFRDTEHHAGPVLSADRNFDLFEPAREISPPPGAVLRAMLDAWAKLRKRARVLILVDVSGRGDADLRWARQPLLSAVGRFDQGDQFGAWAFPALGGSATPYVEVQAIGAGSLESTLGNLHASDGRVDLPAAVEAAVARVGAGYDPARINAILLVTASTDPAEQVDLERFLRNQPPDRFVRLFVVQHQGGPPASTAAFAKLAAAGRGAYYSPDTSAHFESDLVSNF